MALHNFYEDNGHDLTPTASGKQPGRGVSQFYLARLIANETSADWDWWGVLVTWAQRSSADEPERNYLYVSIKTPDVPKEKADLKLSANNVSFTGPSGKGVTYSVSLDLFGEIDPENSKVNHTDREVELVLRKKELGEEYWPRLLKEKQKVHFLKTDFDKV